MSAFIAAPEVPQPTAAAPKPRVICTRGKHKWTVGREQSCSWFIEAGPVEGRYRLQTPISPPAVHHWHEASFRLAKALCCIPPTIFSLALIGQGLYSMISTRGDSSARARIAPLAKRRGPLQRYAPSIGRKSKESTSTFAFPTRCIVSQSPCCPPHGPLISRMPECTSGLDSLMNSETAP
jgi:hypothetical protein